MVFLPAPTKVPPSLSNTFFSRVGDLATPPHTLSAIAISPHCDPSPWLESETESENGIWERNPSRVRGHSATALGVRDLVRNPESGAGFGTHRHSNTPFQTNTCSLLPLDADDELFPSAIGPRLCAPSGQAGQSAGCSRRRFPPSLAVRTLVCPAGVLPAVTVATSDARPTLMTALQWFRRARHSSCSTSSSTSALCHQSIPDEWVPAHALCNMAHLLGKAEISRFSQAVCIGCLSSLHREIDPPILLNLLLAKPSQPLFWAASQTIQMFTHFSLFPRRGQWSPLPCYVRPLLRCILYRPPIHTASHSRQGGSLHRGTLRQLVGMAWDSGTTRPNLPFVTPFPGCTPLSTLMFGPLLRFTPGSRRHIQVAAGLRAGPWICLRR
jgi:hypothetical protein